MGSKMGWIGAMVGLGAILTWIALKSKSVSSITCKDFTSRSNHVVKVNPHSDEDQYLELIRVCLKRRTCLRLDRTLIGTVGVFGHQMRFSLRGDRFPLLTTKKVIWKSVAEELFWFISGSTNAKQLATKGVHIWDANGSRAFLDKQGLAHRAEGDLGPVYGFQWRHFGAKYRGMHANYTGEGVDQLAECVRLLREDPFSRRIVLTAWNPAALQEMALPPCHMFCQFYVSHDRKLSCLLYQRSGDVGLGVPFNIASYALLCRLMGQVTDLECDELVHVIGDAHVYQTHIRALEEQLQRPIRPAPRLRFSPSARKIRDLSEFRWEHLILEDYNPHGFIRMEMAL